MKRLVFICTGNTCRSPMAQGLFIKHLEERNPELKGKVEVVTAGLSTISGESASPEAMAVMKEVGVDLSAHKTQTVTEEILSEADWILTMTRSHRDYLLRTYGKNEKLYSLYEFLGQDKDVQDPYGWGEETYRVCRDEIKQLVELLLTKLASEIDLIS